jgi:hypothetical protein
MNLSEQQAILTIALLAALPMVSKLTPSERRSGVRSSRWASKPKRLAQCLPDVLSAHHGKRLA